MSPVRTRDKMNKSIDSQLSAAWVDALMAGIPVACSMAAAAMPNRPADPETITIEGGLSASRIAMR